MSNRPTPKSFNFITKHHYPTTHPTLHTSTDLHLSTSDNDHNQLTFDLEDLEDASTQGSATSRNKQFCFVNSRGRIEGIVMRYTQREKEYGGLRGVREAMVRYPRSFKFTIKSPIF
jgi:hypothetical protein